MAGELPWWTLPPSVYASAEVFADEVTRVLRPGWLNVGHVSLVAKRGDFRCVDVVGERLVLTRRAIPCASSPRSEPRQRAHPAN
jgi:phenylpropionate dioxygenase-like ring-hydroxylating dioxygenase large terminal subunit